MDDLDRLLADSMRGAADRAPSDAGLLGTVHRRSRRYRRRRIATGLSTVAAALALGVPFVAVMAHRPDPSVPPLTSAPAASATPATPATSATSATPAPSAPSHTSPTSASPSSRSSRSSPDGAAVKLIDGWTAPAFPYTLPATDGMTAPIATLDRGRLIAFFEATELQEHADTTITVSAAEPVFTTGATTRSLTVRGHEATLRTVDVEPAKQLTLVWREAPGRWIQLATDDTYTRQEVAALAESLTDASIAVSPPFELGLSPAGLVADSVTRSTMSFRTPGAAPGTPVLSVVLRRQRQLTGADDKVGSYAAALTRDGDGATLAVDVTDWDATLEITVDAALTISDAELLRFAEGVRILNRSDPQ